MLGLLWGTMNSLCCGSGKRNAATSTAGSLQQTHYPTRDCDRRSQSALVCKPIPARRSSTCSGPSATQPSAGWARPSTAVCRARKQSSRPNSCCPGHFRRKLRPRNTWHSCRSAQYVGGRCKSGGALGHYRRRRMGRVENAAPDPLYQHLIVTAERKFWRCVENGEVPTLFGVRAAKAAHRGGSRCRHELVQRFGGIRQKLCPNPTCISRARKSQGRIENSDAPRCTAGYRPWRTPQTVEIRRHRIRTPQS